MTIAVRGNTTITDQNVLRAHLANVLRLENIGLLIGAGASVAAGGKIVKQVWRDFVQADGSSAEWLRDNNFVTEDDISEEDPSVPNIELLADRLAIAIAEWVRVNDDKLDDGRAAQLSLRRAVVRAAVLKDAWWREPTAVSFDEADLLTHRTVLQKLTSSRQPGQSSPWIFTTNYDLAVEWAAESIDMSIVNGFIGTHSRRFSAQSFDLAFRNVQARGEARFGAYHVYLAKLHGSLSWKEQEGQFIETQATALWAPIKAFIDGGVVDPGSLVLPSAGKYMQTIGFVLGELLRRFAEFLAKPQSCLIVSGYGFGDDHINRLLTSALLNPTLQLVIYLPEFVDVNNLAALPASVRRVVALKNPRVTLVGGGAAAYFSALADDLPEPALYDDNLLELEHKLKGDQEGGRQ